MNKSGFTEVMNELALAYNGKFALNPIQDADIKGAVMRTWYRFFSKFEEEAFSRVVENWIKKEPKAPAISDLYQRTKDLSERMAKEKEPTKEKPIPTEWDFKQSADSKIMTYEEWVNKYFGDRK